MYEFERLFDRPGDQERVRPGTLGYRVRTIRSGSLIEVECYPVWGRMTEQRARRQKVTPERMAAVNRRNSVRRLQRKLECNFGEGDLVVTLTYDDNRLPDEAGAEKELDRYLARLRYAASKRHARLRYVAVTEISSTGRVHHHLAVGGLDRATVEGRWKNGYANTKVYQRRPGGWGGLAGYMLKTRATQQKMSVSRWRCSTGLKEPTVTVSDHKISARRMEAIAAEMDMAAPILMSIYRDCDFEDGEIRSSAWMPGAYLYAKLRRRK